LRRLGWSALEHHALNSSLQVPVFVLPVLVTVLLSATTNAYFYMASMFASAVSVIPIALSTSLFAVGSHEPFALSSRTRLTLALSTGGSALAALALVGLARPLLGLFGREYQDEVEWILRLSLVALLPAIVKAHYVAISQLYGRMRRAALVVALSGAAELAAAALGATLGGLEGLIVARLAVMFLTAAYMAPTVLAVAWTRVTVGSE
jgi:O-antigen/teichoic acid export membrane protein